LFSISRSTGWYPDARSELQNMPHPKDESSKVTHVFVSVVVQRRALGL
jgi:hypothetical protein